MGKRLTIAILGLGGQGGGVLADWVVQLGEANGYVAQGTSVPGVAQRTGGSPEPAQRTSAEAEPGLAWPAGFSSSLSTAAAAAPSGATETTTSATASPAGAPGLVRSSRFAGAAGACRPASRLAGVMALRSDGVDIPGCQRVCL